MFIECLPQLNIPILQDFIYNLLHWHAYETDVLALSWYTYCCFNYSMVSLEQIDMWVQNWHLYAGIRSSIANYLRLPKLPYGCKDLLIVITLLRSKFMSVLEWIAQIIVIHCTFASMNVTALLRSTAKSHTGATHWSSPSAQIRNYSLQLVTSITRPLSPRGSHLIRGISRCHAKRVT